MNSLINWLIENYQWILGLLVQIFIACLVLLLSIKLSSKAKLKHKAKIKKKAEELLSNIQKENLNRKVYLININRYYKDYPSNKEKLLSGYSLISAEIKSTKFDGVEFFDSLLEVYRKSNGKLSFKGDKDEYVFNVYRVGIIPYEWIEYMDLQGDEYSYRPSFYCHFKGKRYWQRSWKRFLPFGYPYKKLVYYRESDHYTEGKDPADWKYSSIDEPISNK